MNSEKLIASGDSWMLAALCEFSLRNHLPISSIRVERLLDGEVNLYGTERVGEIQSYIFCHAAVSGQAYYDASALFDHQLFDLIYLYPVERLEVGDYKALISRTLSQLQLKSIVESYEFPVRFEDLGISEAERATELLKVRLRNRIVVRFVNQTLYIEACGYLQIQEILKLFGECCVEAKLNKSSEILSLTLEENETWRIQMYYAETGSSDETKRRDYFIKSSSGHIINVPKEYNITERAKNIMRAYPNFIPSNLLSET
jgi:hypothetical protein